MKKIVLVLAAVLLVSACGGAKTKMGLVKQAPDEFMVMSRAPLTLPPDYDLKPINEVKVDNDAKFQGLSKGEEAFLRNVDAGAAPDDIKSKIDEEMKLLHE